VLVVLRVVGLTLVVAVATTVLAWMLTGDRKWLRLAWQIFKYGVYALAFLLLMFAGEALFHAG
jgi:fructose-specific phosphotransferase system IIC component